MGVFAMHWIRGFAFWNNIIKFYKYRRITNNGSLKIKGLVNECL